LGSFPRVNNSSTEQKNKQFIKILPKILKVKKVFITENQTCLILGARVDLSYFFRQHIVETLWIT